MHDAMQSKKSIPLSLVSTAVASVLAIILAIALVLLPKPTDTDLVYGIMIDAGSTGTRALIGTFSLQTPSPSASPLSSNSVVSFRPTLVLKSRQVVDISGGIGQIALLEQDDDQLDLVHDPQHLQLAIRTYLSPLFSKIKSIVPPEKLAKTPLFFKATAGLRLLGTYRAQAVIEAVRALDHVHQFMYQPHWISMLDEHLEGKYAWMTVNYLMKNFEKDLSVDVAHAETIGTLDLGGGSIQITLASLEDDANQCHENVFHHYFHPVNLGSTSISIYTKSHLGFGLYDFQQKLYLHLEKNDLLLKNPCFYKAEMQAIKIGLRKKTFQTLGTGDFMECVHQSRTVLGITDEEAYTCDHGDGYCSIDGHFQPRPRSIFIAFAYFYDRTNVLGLPHRVSPKDIKEKGIDICKMNLSELKQKVGVSIRNGTPEELCGDLSYIYALLRYGLNFDEETPCLWFEQYIDDHVIGWALGALLEEIQNVDINALL